VANIDNFKLFVKNNPKLINYVKDGTMSWQKFYELYDLYGEDNSVWDSYIVKKEEIKKQEVKDTRSTFSLSNIMEMAKNIDTNKLQDGITSVQKAISLFGDMLVKDNNNETSNNYTPRPIYRRFDD